MTQFVFETFNAPAFYVSNQAILSPLATHMNPANTFSEMKASKLQYGNGARLLTRMMVTSLATVVKAGARTVKLAFPLNVLTPSTKSNKQSPFHSTTAFAIELIPQLSTVNMIYGFAIPTRESEPPTPPTTTTTNAAAAAAADPRVPLTRRQRHKKVAQYYARKYAELPVLLGTQLFIDAVDYVLRKEQNGRRRVELAHHYWDTLIKPSL
ncbi:hypothetical protein M7I_5028 [Glarea lozoyensis 74030]|uniref:Uncharacterized protein n=1 Tax=Glarea lozoyensis (strain ATCC 74030 / MF5533) TaxID=1104152 RepID=H0EQS3_GLAL7|nr:hypothetical protein M7I_5028 [Glarea lozoyensis 74030]